MSGTRKRNKLVGGWGVNDADYNVYPTIGGKKVMCPFYRTWNNMIVRCHNKGYQEKKPTYLGCYIIEEWRYFSNFKLWMESQSWGGKVLDKDLLLRDNKCYSPINCVFIDSLVNLFVTDSGATRGLLPIGVCYKKSSGRYSAMCHNPFVDEKSRHIGYFSNPLEAHYAWQARKHEIACLLADSEYVDDERVVEALRKRYAPSTDWLEGWTMP